MGREMKRKGGEGERGERGREGERETKLCSIKNRLLNHFLNLNFADKVSNRRNVDSVQGFIQNTT